MKGTRALFLDMMQTFMFGNDRFSDEEDYENSYLRFGGERLESGSLQIVIQRALDEMTRDYALPEYQENFPVAEVYLRSSLKAVVPEMFSSEALLEREVRILDRVFAWHETGFIPQGIAKAIKSLSGKFQLATISNVWGNSSFIHQELYRSGVSELMEQIVISSEVGLQKPGSAIFQYALNEMNLAPEDVIMIGDDPILDVLGAMNAGLSVIHLNHSKTCSDVSPWKSFADLVQAAEFLLGPDFQ